MSNRLPIATARVLKDHEAKTAASLLYDVYTSDGGWTPPAGNPSGLRIESHDGHSILTDDLTTDSTWVGCFLGADLVAATRLVRGYEIARYQTLPPWLSGVAGLEVNRFVVRPGFGNAAVLAALAEEVLAQARSSGRPTLVTAVTTPEPADTFVALGFERVGMAPFRYHESDPLPVEALHLDLTSSAARAFDRDRLRELFGGAG